MQTTGPQKFVAGCTLVLAMGGVALAIVYLSLLLTSPRESEAQDLSALTVSNRVAFAKMLERSGTATRFPVSAVLVDPVQIVIPALGVDTKIQAVGLTASGKMGTPKGDRKYKDVAWYKDGFKPGEKGAAVIAGHLDNGYGLAAVFKELQSLKLGDSIFVSDADGKTLHFKVSKKVLYPAGNEPVSDVFGESDEPRLNLITCDGDWIENERGYSQRLVVYTELVR